MQDRGQLEKVNRLSTSTPAPRLVATPCCSLQAVIVSPLPLTAWSCLVSLEFTS
jgi:hypothetical protein